MFRGKALKQHLLGTLEIALFMPHAKDRFSSNEQEAWKSFIIPILLFPLSIIAIQILPKTTFDADSANALSLMLSLRIAFSWLLFFGAVYWIAKHCDRLNHFSKFVVASNWLTIPATLAYLPVAWCLLSGTHSWEELYPFMMCVTGYTYLMLAYMAAVILKMPFELGGFIVMLNIMINNSTEEITYWVDKFI